MSSFQEDLVLTFNNIHSKYLNKYNEVIKDNNEILHSMTLDECELLIKYIKEFKTNTENIIDLLDNINNIKGSLVKQNLIEVELQQKMLPIIMIYRTLLEQKHSQINENN